MLDSLNKENTLIVGLGNPGLAYRHNRHNVGFMVAEALAEKIDIPLKRVKFKAQIGNGKYEGIPVIIAKPLTFMNNSGEAVAPLVRYFKVPLERLLVIHDDMDLPLGTLRMRPSGGSAGHNGMLSIFDKLGTNAIPRLRVGIGRPPGRMDPADYVLQDFPKSDEELLKMVIGQACEAALAFITTGLEKAMNIHNGEVG
ncbi:MAG TPA: aminoacyl-tRNA hydrolase [Anaerolineaceae bacterium]|nr:MAG: Aminoacyl-tRNA hydrolase [Anaerolineae bacterium 49_20]HAE86246.1 aminoacyl-tRNA hydrolase [Anaerolineaceae bacterium]